MAERRGRQPTMREMTLRGAQSEGLRVGIPPSHRNGGGINPVKSPPSPAIINAIIYGIITTVLLLAYWIALKEMLTNPDSWIRTGSIILLTGIAIILTFPSARETMNSVFEI